jgi:Ca-activated chloride channel family protein
MLHPHHAILMLLTTSLVACTSRFDAAHVNPSTGTAHYDDNDEKDLEDNEAMSQQLESRPQPESEPQPQPEPEPEPQPEPQPQPVLSIESARAESRDVMARGDAGLSASAAGIHGATSASSVSRQAQRTGARRQAPLMSASAVSELAPPPPPPSGYYSSPDLSTEQDTEEYTDYGVNGFTMTSDDARSTFSIDVDTASYTMARRKLESGSLPPIAAVRVEEFVNYFDYGYAPPPHTGDNPLRVHFDAFPDPFREGRHIMRIGVQAKELPVSDRPPLHLTFLVDVSGSMSSSDKLPLAQESLKMLVASMQEGDTVALATYAGRTAEVLGPTDASNVRRINEAIDSLESGGSTAMSSGLDLAYSMALRSFEEGAENRVIVLSDGDANVGSVGWEAMLTQIKEKADMGVTISTVGFGMGNYRDTLMEQLSNKGDGNNYYIDSMEQGKRVFTTEMTGTVFTIARDVKIQVEFHEDSVSAYRLIGYENRDIADRDFRNDRVDAGEIGSGHNVTALYEVILREGYNERLATVRVRHESPGADKAATEHSYPFPDSALQELTSQASRSSRIAYAAATFAEVLRDSPHSNEMSLDAVISLAESARRPGEADDQELIRLMRSARSLGAGPGVGVTER